jgi:hypothetical protein
VKECDNLFMDGEPTPAFWELWHHDRHALRMAGWFVGREGGQWKVKRGLPRRVFAVRCRGRVVPASAETAWHPDRDSATRHLMELQDHRARIVERTVFERPRFADETSTT